MYPNIVTVRNKVHRFAPILPPTHPGRYNWYPELVDLRGIFFLSIDPFRSGAEAETHQNPDRDGSFDRGPQDSLGFHGAAARRCPGHGEAVRGISV